VTLSHGPVQGSSHRVDDQGGSVVIGLVAEYVNEFSAILGVPFANKAIGFALLSPAGWPLSLTWAATRSFAAGYCLMVSCCHARVPWRNDRCSSAPIRAGDRPIGGHC
jgi:hypothetical protein